MSIQTEIETTIWGEESFSHSVFLCFSSSDRAEVEKFKASIRLRHPKLRVLEHPVRRKYDRNWKTHCDIKIRKSSALICLIGNDTHRSSAVRWELDKAKNCDVPIVPVYLKEFPPYPPVPSGLTSSPNSQPMPTLVEELALIEAK